MGCLKKVWTPIRDTVESAAVLGGNYLLPGSSMLTSNLASKGSQDQLNSTLGKVAQIGTGLTGSGVGASTTGIPSASSIGAGWTNAANAAGGLVGDATLGTDISNGFSNILGGSSGANGILSAGDGTLANAPNYSTQTLNASFDPALGASPAATTSSGGYASLTPSGVSSAGIGGGISSYGAGVGESGGSLSKLLGGNGLQVGGALLGAANSLYANNQAQKDLVSAGNNANAMLAPYQATGVAANNKLSNLLGTGDSANAMTADDILAQNPQYKFQLDQGNQALDRRQAATGNYFSGGALKEAQNFGQGLANQTAQQYYGELAQQAGQGQNAASTAGNISQGIGSAQAGAGINSANITNQTLSSLLSGSGAKRAINIGGQIVYI